MKRKFNFFLVLYLAFWLPVIAAAKHSDIKTGHDHPRVPRLSGFYISGYEEHQFDREAFKTNSGRMAIEGRKFVIDYRLEPGAVPPGKSRILTDYQKILSSPDTTLMLDGPYYSVFRVVGKDFETWVKVDPGNDDGKRYILTIVDQAEMKPHLSPQNSRLSSENDIEGSRDHPLLPRMPNFYIAGYEKQESGRESYKTNDGKINVEGRKYVIDYRIRPGIVPPGKIQILRSYDHEMKAKGGASIFKGPYYDVFVIMKNGLQTWVKVDPGNDDGKRYTLTIVEKKGTYVGKQLRSKTSEMIQTATLQMTGLKPEDRVIRTETLVLTGLRPEDRLIRTDILQMTGLAAQNRIIKADKLMMTGFGE